jgi:hypothetical protein
VWRIYVEASIWRVDQMENPSIVRGTITPISYTNVGFESFSTPIVRGTLFLLIAYG